MTHMMLPSQILVNGRWYTFSYKKGKLKDGDVECYGLCHHDRSLIEVSLGEHKTHQELLLTILHEIMHAVLYVTGHSATLDNLEEGIIMALEITLMPLLKFQRNHAHLKFKRVVV